MKPVYLSIQQEATGKRMKELLRKNGYSVKDIQEAMGFESPQAVYKWLSGRSLPNLDNFLILSRILHTSIEDILVVDGDIVRYKQFRTAGKQGQKQALSLLMSKVPCGYAFAPVFTSEEPQMLLVRHKAGQEDVPS